MTLSREIAQHAADTVAAVSIPVSVGLWLTDLDVVLRILVSIGSLVLIGFAIAAKVRHWRRAGE